MKIKPPIILIVLLICLFNLITSGQRQYLDGKNTNYHDIASCATELPSGSFVFGINRMDTNYYYHNSYAKSNFLFKSDNYGNVFDSLSFNNLGFDSLTINDIYYHNDTLSCFGMAVSFSSQYRNIFKQIVCFQLDTSLNLLNTQTYLSPLNNYGFSLLQVKECTNGFVLLTHLFNDTLNGDLSSLSPHKYLLRILSSGDSVASNIINYYNVLTPSVAERIDSPGHFVLVTSNTKALGNVTAFMYYLNSALLIVDSLPLKIVHPVTHPYAVGGYKDCKMLSSSTFLLAGNNSYSSVGSINNNLSLGRWQLFDSIPDKIDTMARFDATDKFHWQGFSLDNLSWVNSNNIYHVGSNMGNAGSLLPSNNNYIVVSNRDSNLNQRWIKYYGGDASYNINRILATKDGGCLVLGHFKSNVTQSNQIDLYIFKIDSTGKALWTRNFSQFESEVTIFPNPAKDFLHVQSAEKIQSYEIINMAGQRLIKQLFKGSIDVSIFPKGYYFIKLINDKGEYKTIKWLKD